MSKAAISISICAFNMGCSGFSASSLTGAKDVGPPSGLSVLAGQLGGTGLLNGTGTATRFFQPRGFAFDSSGAMYVADFGNHVIRKVSASFVTSTFAGIGGISGSSDGILSTATFSNPWSLAFDSLGNLFVSDFGNHTIRKISTTGAVSTFAGMAGSPGSVDGTGSAARFNQPTAIAVDSINNVYVADTGNHTIRRITPSGVVSTYAGTAGSTGSTNGPTSSALFNVPNGLVFDTSGNLYVSEGSNYAVRKISTSLLVSTLAGSTSSSGSTDGNGSTARFGSLIGLTIDSSGNLYVVDTSNNKIRKIDSSANVSTFAGSGAYGVVDGTGIAAQFSGPNGIAIDSNDSLYVGDAVSVIRRITANGRVATILGQSPHPGASDGTGALATFNQPSAVTVDTTGAVYVADLANYLIRKISRTGVVSTVAGSAGHSGANDGSGGDAQFTGVLGLATDHIGNVYVADSAASTIRKISASGVVTTLAGTAGSPGLANGTGSAARFYYPWGLAVDGNGNIFIADYFNSAIRKMTSAGVVTTIAGGSGSGSSDGIGMAAKFNHPTALAIDSRGILYIADSGNNTIRAMGPDATVSTIAGTSGNSGYLDGDALTAKFGSIYGLSIDSVGNLYVADTTNNVIRKITTSGTVSTVLGSSGSSGVLTGMLPGSVAQPSALVVTESMLYVLGENSVIQCLKP